MKKKIIALGFCAMILGLGFHAGAQQAKKIPRIGYLSSFGSQREPRREWFFQGLLTLGYIEGKNIVIEARYAEGRLDRLPDLAAELVRLNVEVIVVGDSAAIRPAAQATSRIPIVMTVSNDPVGAGYIVSLARPGGNITGLSNLSSDLFGKRLELLQEVVPKLSRVVVLGPRRQRDWSEMMESVATPMGIKLRTLNVQDSTDFAEAFDMATRERIGGIIVLPAPITNTYRKQIVALAAKSRLPAIYGLREYVDAGGLIAYGPNIPEMHRRAAVYVDKILKGAKPAELPVEQPTKFDFVINLKTAKQIGLTIPPNVLARADRVIK
jgi:putative ABC transport system substrate-binding protein